MEAKTKKKMSSGKFAAIWDGVLAVLLIAADYFGLNMNYCVIVREGAARDDPSRCSSGGRRQ